MASDPTELRHSSPECSGDAGAEDPAAAAAALDAAEKSGGDIAEAAPPRPPEPEKVAHHGVLPLLGKPYFTCIMCKSHVQPPFQVVVPRSFAPLLPSRTTPATLSWRGRSWGMRFTGGRLIQRLEAGWRGFAVDNDLRLGDGCVFELLLVVGGGGGGEQERVEFRVQVLRAEIPARIRGRAGGYTSAAPIVID
uniref:TF-B3 domain-containing protein n=1 Tax=Oryza meridionalis TaxID=40149 RepID=A0A0E0DDE4_9ORYZ